MSAGVRRRWLAGCLAAVAALAGAAACVEEPASAASGSASGSAVGSAVGDPAVTPLARAVAPPVLPALVADGYEGRYRVRATVLQSPQHGPRLCFGLAGTVPPTCGAGVDLAGWSWDAVPSDSVGGTTWGDYLVVGTYEDGVVRITEAPSALVPGHGAAPLTGDRSATVCPEPAGGWGVVDQARASRDARDAAYRLLGRSEGIGAVWVDRRGPRDDPRRAVLTATTTGDVEALAASVRGVWGGPLCLTRADRSREELERLLDALPEPPGTISAGVDERAGLVVFDVVLATEEEQRALDEQAGPGVVRLSGQLEAVD